MESDFLHVELIQNREIVATVCAEISSLGLLLIGNGCDDDEAIIVGFLCEQKEKAWALCGACIRKLPVAPSYEQGGNRDCLTQGQMGLSSWSCR
jgi:hypothetical protein